MRSSLWAAGSMPSNSDSELSAAAADNVVAFEVDYAGGTRAPGWGVVMIELAQEHTELCAVPRARGPGCVQHSDVPADPDVALAVTGHRSSPRAGWRPTCPPSSPGRSPAPGSCRSCLAAPRPAGTTPSTSRRGRRAVRHGDPADGDPRQGHPCCGEHGLCDRGASRCFAGSGGTDAWREMLAQHLWACQQEQAASTKDPA